jgi:hypothetical protein
MGVDHRRFHIAVMVRVATWPKTSVAEPLRISAGSVYDTC